MRGAGVAAGTFLWQPAAAIDKHIYVCANRRFYNTIRLAYSKTETVESVDEIDHRIFREALRFTNIENAIELISVADMPANSGLGSSSTFTVALLNALHAYKREFVPTEQLAEEACHIEMEILKEPKNSLVKQYQTMLEFENVSLRFTDDAIEAIAEEALARNVGARGLKIIIEDLMLDVMYQIPSDDDIEECVITRDVVKNHTNPITILRKAG